MNSQDERFFKELGVRIVQAREDHGITKQQFVSPMLETALAQAGH